jgi:hypothetical protein
MKKSFLITILIFLSYTGIGQNIKADTVIVYDVNGNKTTNIYYTNNTPTTGYYFYDTATSTRAYARKQSFKKKKYKQ